MIRSADQHRGVGDHCHIPYDRTAKASKIFSGDPVDVPTPAFTGEKIVSGLAGFTPEGTAVLTQARPGRLQVRNVTVQART